MFVKSNFLHYMYHGSRLAFCKQLREIVNIRIDYDYDFITS